LVAQGHEAFRLPVGNERDKIMRYEAHLSCQLDQAKYELEILQKPRQASRNCKTNQEPGSGAERRMDDGLLSWKSTVAGPG